MTYDIDFMRLQPGRTFQETLDEINAAFDPDADIELVPMDLTGEQRAVWDRIVRRISREVGPVTTGEFRYSLTLWRDGPVGRLQLNYDGNSASVQIPYRYSGEAALPIVEEAYRIARVVEQESGLVGHDFQTDRPVGDGAVEAAAADLGGIAGWVAENLT
ncbi:hypothetical protein ABZ769_09910 [Streptomyces olivoreticuli]